MKKRIMAMLLALCMVLSICVPIAVADDEQPEEKAVVPECSCWGAGLGLPLSSHGIINNCDRQNFCKEEINTTVSHMVYNWADYPDDVKTYLVELLTGDEAYAEKYAELQKELKLEDNRPQITVEDKSPTVGGYKPSVSVEGQTVRMDKYAKATLSAGDDTTWQICIDTTSEIWQWTDITGGQGSLTVSYGLIGSLLTEKNGEYHAYLRAYRTYKDGEAQLRAYSKIYTIVMDLSEPDLSEGQSFPTPDFEEMTPSDAAPASMEEPAPASTEEPAPASTEEPAPASTEEPAPVATETDSAAAGANAVIPASLSETGAETGDVIEPSVTTAEPTFIQPVLAFPQADGDAPTTYVILINYQFVDGTQAAPSWSATVAAGSTYTQDIQSPVVVGYTPNQAVVHVSTSEAKIYTVTYQPAEVDFTVKHYQQNVSNDEYTLADTETKKGFTESAVGAGLAKTDYTGFYSLLYDTTTTIAADGSTVVEVYYDRYYYLMNFNLDGGYGVEPIYARFGTPISVDTPTKPGYTFVSWTPSIPSTMPDENTSYTASWKIGESGFTVVFWYENANDNGYSVAGTYKPANVKPGTEKKSDDYKNQSFTGRDTKHFTYNAAKAETVTVKGDGSTVLNVYYTRNTYTLTFRELTCSRWHTHNNSCYKVYKTITAKYQADIHSNFPIKDGNNTIWWNVPDGCESFKADAMLGSIDTMPGENIVFEKAGPQSGAVLYYYIETLQGETGTYTHDGKSFTLYKQITLEKECQLTYSEEFHNITGFTQWWSDPKFDKMEQGGVAYAGYHDGGWFGDSYYYINEQNYLCYTRNSYNLKFYNYNAYVSEPGHSVQYEAPLKGYDNTPAYPDGLEPNAYQFAGWYTTVECFDGTEVNWKTAKMPASDVILYAKWVPKTHTVRTWLTNKLDTPVNVIDGNEQKILHGRKAVKPVQPKNGNYTFVGWFYMENGVEHGFEFDMPITKDLDLYARWSSNTLVKYTIWYVLKDGTEIAPPTTGSALAGSTKTFNAKTGDALNEGYQTGYFPETSSHSITVNIEDPSQNTYTFVYVPKEKVTYTVQYLEKGTGNELAEPKTVTTSDAVVTETFKQITGYAPDAYQKQLVLAAENNEIIFWYTKDEVHAPVQIIHWIQNIEGEDNTEYQSSTNVNGVIGETYTEASLTIQGFAYNADKSNASGELTAAGLILNLYYDRIVYPYAFRFLKKDTEETLADPVKGNARYQAQVTQTAKEIPGYTLTSAEQQAIIIAVEEGGAAVKNVKTFYYTEKTVDIKYQVVGPDNCGALDNYQDANLAELSGTPKGSTPTASAGFSFVGWYKDKDCTQPVDAGWVKDSKLTPQKTKDYGGGVMGYEAKTYYAKFAYDVFDLTVSKSGADAVDENQTFIFLISGEGVKMEVVVHGNSRVTVKGLKVGTYTVTELTDWSWRYKPDEPQKTVSQTDAQQAAANQTAHTVNFVNKRTNSKWLNGAAFCDNRWNNSATVEIN